AFRVHARYAGSGLRVLDEPLAVPDQNTSIEFVVKDAGSGDGIAPDGGVDPWAVAKAWHALAVQLEGDFLRASARGVFAENTAHDLGLFLDNRALAPDRLAIGGELVNDA